MKKSLTMVAGLALAAGQHGAATAATFTPDMWVYEVTLTAKELSLADFFAWTTAPAGTPVPEGCTSITDEAGPVTIFCDVNPGIDLFATMDEDQRRQYLDRSGRIGFNQSQVVCDETLVACPMSGEEPVVSFATSLDDFFFTSITLDAMRGRLSFCGAFYIFSGGCYELRPGSVTASAGETAVPSLRGTWDYGFGGQWLAGNDPYFLYSGTGRLLSPASNRPAVIPLPAPLLMLGSGLLALGAFRRRATVRTPARAAHG